MRLHRLAVKDFRGVTEREIAFADTGVTLLHGPNEAGKSSMVEALQLLLEVKATSKSQRVEAVCPAHRDAGPFVEAELTVGPYRFVYAKQYHRRPGTVLTVLEPTPLQLTGGSAESWVAEQMATHVDGDLLAALTVLQGPGPGQPSLRDSAAFAKALDSASGGAGEDEPGAERLAEAVAAERARYFTPTGRPTGELAAARTREAATRASLESAEAALREVDRVVEQHALASARLAALVDRRSAAATALEALSADQERIGALQSRLAQSRAVLEAAALREQHAGDAANRRRRLVDRQALAVERTAQVRVQRDRALADREVLAAEASWLETTVHELSAVSADRRERKSQAQYAVDYARESMEYQRIVRRIEQAQLLGKDVEDARNRLAASPIDRRALQTIAVAEQRYEKAQARFSALAATLKLERLGFSDVLVDGRHIGEEPVEVVAGNGTVIDVPGAVRIEVVQRGESADAAAEVKAAHTALLAACRDAGAEDVAAARELHEQRDAVEIELQEARIALAHALGDNTLAELRQLAEESAERIVALETAVDPELLAVDPERAKANLMDATQAEVASRGEERQTREQLGQKQQELHRASTDAQVAADRLQHFDQQASELTAELERARAEAADDAVGTAADAAVAAREAATAEVAAHEAAAREADVAGFAARFAAARAQDERARAAEASAREELAGLNGQLHLFQADGRRDRLDAAEAEHVHAERGLTSVEERARAASLLHETLTAHRAARRARVQAPYQRALEELGRTVFGDPLTITVGDDLTIASRTVDGVTVPFDSLSGGAQEQLGVLSRLACARLVDGADGAPVIFDDALGHSDPTRLGAMADALVEAGRGAQVIVFSCVPGRFDALRGRDGVTEVALG
ncbi:AAA family ATPase [Tsukamurella ocularis]|uniref:AAA family ATPase n=1 Tax=Tsukamurella ocularis TaxID=1970234 RepID=UPI00216737AE|nr:AAA family ATPase [Tsukamurella ocularis]MCS3780640.1 chromosome segregation ATPase [Tsukamurella ocularis]MCS3786464.1 chromosome segregation ATPase [Tsukamurella ocularis]MCS3850306.1 chromosome segregation ATPase [Tsukamurella ocularis]